MQNRAAKNASQSQLQTDPQSALLALFPTAVIVVRMGGQVVFANQRAQDEFGIQAGQDIHDFFNEYFEQHPGMMSGAQAPEKFNDFEVTFHRSQGAPQYALVSTRPFEFEGEPALLASLVDVSAHRQAESALKKERDLNQNLIQASSAFFVAIAPNGRVLMMNQSMLDALGYTLHEVIGADYLSSFIPKAERAALADIFAQVTPDGKSVVHENHILTKEGEQIWVEWRGRPIFNGQEFEYLFGLGIDVTERKRAQEDLRQSEYRYHSVVSALQEGIVLQNAEGVIEASNASAETILGLSADQMMGRKSLDPRWHAIHEDGSPFPGEMHPAMYTLCTGETLSNVIMGVHKPNGSLTWVSINSQPIQPPDAASPLAVVTSFVDITERKRIEDKLALQVERMEILRKLERAITSRVELKRILDLLVSEIVQQLNVDSCAVLLFNPQTNRLEFAAKKGFRTSALDATRLNLGLGLAGQAAQKHKTVFISNLQAVAAENPTLWKAVGGEKFVSYLGVPLYARKQLLGVLEIFHRTELAPNAGWFEFIDALADQAAISIDNARLLEATQQSLKETNALYAINQYLIATIDHELLMTNVVDLLQKSFHYYYVQIFIVDHQSGNFILRAGSGEIGKKLKAQRYFLPAGEGIVGFTAATQKPFFTNNVDQVISFVRPPYLTETKSELAVPIRVNEQFLGLLDVHQQPPAVLTERDMQLVLAVADQLAVALQKARMYADLQAALQNEQTTRAHLLQAEKLTLAGRLLASVSHELNNPIQAIQNALFLLRKERDISAQGRQDLELVLSETERMATMLTRLRATYQPDSRDEFQPVQLNDLVEDTCALVSTHLRHNRISYSLLTDPNLPVISGLAINLRQVILNLVMNAVDAMPAGGHLTLITQALPKTREVLLEVTDTGSGIDPAIFANMFEAFVTSKEQGTGLGLAISYEIIQKHRGRIAARNNPDQGATFSLWLPVDSGAGQEQQ